METAVVTVTVNPAVDVSMSVARMLPDHKLRSEGWAREPGGGGVNVARVLRRLGIAARAFVVVGGATGEELVDLVRADGVDVDRFDIDGTTRESMAVTETSTGHQYRITAPGPRVVDHRLLGRAVVERVKAATVVVLSGSLCPGMPDDFFADLILELGPGVTTIVDTNGAALKSVVETRATLVKPSQRELAALVGWTPVTSDQIECAVQEVLAAGSVDSIVASRGPAGALLAQRGQRAVWFHPPPVHPVSTVGAGDSMVAGIAASLVRGRSLPDAVRYGVAAGTAAVMTPGSALCDVDDVGRLVARVPMWSPKST